MITRSDKVIMISILLVSIAIFLWFGMSVGRETAECVSIFVDGEEYASYRFADITSTKKVDVKTEYGYNLVEISKEGAAVIDASCSDKTDVRMGKITKPGQTILCVPNRVMVKIFGKEKLKVDKVTY